MTNKDKAIALLDVIQALIDVVKENGKSGISEGELYTFVMGKLSLKAFQQITEIMVKSGKVKRDMPHHLVAIEPKGS